MKETELATIETKIVKKIFGVEKYAVVRIAPVYTEDKYRVSYYNPTIMSIHESKENAIKYIQDNDSYGLFIVPITQILKEQYVQH